MTEQRRSVYEALMKRADRGLERLDYNTYTVLIGGLGGVPEDVGIHLKTMYFAPRLGAIYRLTDNSVVRAGYGRTAPLAAKAINMCRSISR